MTLIKDNGKLRDVNDVSEDVAFRPVSANNRIESIDVTRGIALFGILVVNSLLFALPLAVGPHYMPVVEADGAGAINLDFIAWAIVTGLFLGKFISLFSMLFGVGAAIQFDRSASAHRSFNLFFVRRMFVLLFIGVLHGLLFWYGDILAIYALLGIGFLVLCRLDNLPLLVMSVIFLFVGGSLGAGLTALESLAPEMQEFDGDLPETGLGAIMASQVNPADPNWIHGETRAYAEGPYLDLFVFRAITLIIVKISTLIGFGWHVFAMFCLGVAMFRSNFFGDGGQRLRMLAITIALPVGLLLQLGVVLIRSLRPEPNLLMQSLGAFLLDFGSAILAVGYAGLIVCLVRRGMLGKLAHVAACTGRMALTVYLLETVIMTTLFYFYGFGLFGKVDRILLLPISVVVWMLLAVFSTLWLARFRQGPMEAVWRRLSYGSAARRG